jgi:hypothetical protein
VEKSDVSDVIVNLQHQLDERDRIILDLAVQIENYRSGNLNPEEVNFERRLNGSTSMLNSSNPSLLINSLSSSVSHLSSSTNQSAGSSSAQNGGRATLAGSTSALLNRVKRKNVTLGGTETRSLDTVDEATHSSTSISQDGESFALSPDSNEINGEIAGHAATVDPEVMNQLIQAQVSKNEERWKNRVQVIRIQYEAQLADLRSQSEKLGEQLKVLTTRSVIFCHFGIAVTSHFHSLVAKRLEGI